MDTQIMNQEGEWMNSSGWNYMTYAQSPMSMPSPLSCIHFDTLEDRLWTGNEHGRVVSYLGINCQRHTAFVQPGPVRAIETFHSGVLSLTSNLLRAQTRSGVPMFSYSSDKMNGMTCMHQPSESHMYIGGTSQNLLHFDVETQRELRMAKAMQKEILAIRTNGKSVLTADSEGKIGVRDVNSLENVRMLSCHGGSVIDFDVIGNQLISCGVSFRAGNMHGDPYVKIYDLRTFRTLPPIPLSFSPIFSRFLPSYVTGKIILVSQMCQVQLHDLNENSGTPLVIDTMGSPLTAFGLAPSRQVIAFGDASGVTHVMADRADAVFTETDVQSEFADIPAPLVQSFSIDDVSHSLASIPLPFSYDDGYLSDWPEEMCEYAYRKPRPLPEYSSIRTIQHVQHAPNPRAGTPLARFHLCPYDLEKREIKEDSVSRDSDGGMITEDEIDGVPLVPKFYRPCIWKQTIKSGDEIPSLLRFNRTSRVTIEFNNGANFANPVMQALYSIPALRNIFLHHLCEEDACLSCQIGFLFRMMSDKDSSQPASSNNLLRSLRASPFAAKLIVSAAEKVHELIKYVFEDAEKHLSPSDLTHLSSLTSFSLTTNTRCIRCSSVKSEATQMPVLTLSYPSGDPSFCSLLEKSMNGRRSKQAECADCETTTRIEETLRVRSLPPLLIFDANPIASNYRQYWEHVLAKKERRPRYSNPPEDEDKGKTVCRWGEECRGRTGGCPYLHENAVEWEEECARWREEGTGTWSHYVPQRFYARISGGIAALHEHEPDSNDPTESHAYDLVAVVCLISDDPSSQKHWKYVVAECVEEWSKEEPPVEKPWLIINGIAITRVTKDEALHLDYRWKMPLVFIYAKRASLVMTASESRSSIPVDVWERDSCLTGNEEIIRERRLASLPAKGDVVGIDAEFISMSKDGSKKCVGRVSVVDESGEKIIMDDYIAGVDGDVVHDYLTQYSGIEEHDLCRIRSTKHLTTLKASYLKLLHLVERGVVFVGHALFNDFSMLNIHVPADQVRDTVQLFRLPQKRLISLQFLAFHLLDLKIQESSHDSVEDARVSLQLYHKWRELKEAGKLDSMIHWLYEEGKKTNWRMTGSSLLMEGTIRMGESACSPPSSPTKFQSPE